MSTFSFFKAGLLIFLHFHWLVIQMRKDSSGYRTNFPPSFLNSGPTGSWKTSVEAEAVVESAGWLEVVEFIVL